MTRMLELREDFFDQRPSGDWQNSPAIETATEQEAQDSTREIRTQLVQPGEHLSPELREEMRQRILLQDALSMAHHANQAKSTFLASMSHDLRTPMNAILGFTGIALNNMDDPQRVEECLQKILSSSKHLLNLLNDILDVSRIESGKIQIQEEAMDLKDMAEWLNDLFQPQVDERDLSFVLDFSQIKNSLVYGDPLRLNQILVNLIGNAIKFTEPGGNVVVRCYQQRTAPTGYGTYEFSVKDTGCGMSPEFLDHIFEPFTRDDIEPVRKTEGTGLGMSITKNLIDMMGGTIEVSSKLGLGSQFVVRVDLRLQDDSQEAFYKQVESGVAILSKKKLPKRAKFRGKRALIADDDDLSREILCELLKEQGFTVEEANDGQQALQKVAESEPFHYDAILMDMHMPNMDGSTATKAIRLLDRDDTAHLPIIATTANAFSEDRRDALDSGMTEYVSKPINIHRLLDILEKSL